MMWWNGNWSGWAWLWMSIGMVAFWVFIGTVIFLIVRGAQAPREPGHKPEEILAERFSRGEISTEEYEERKKVLAKLR